MHSSLQAAKPTCLLGRIVQNGTPDETARSSATRIMMLAYGMMAIVMVRRTNKAHVGFQCTLNARKERRCPIHDAGCPACQRHCVGQQLPLRTESIKLINRQIHSLPPELQVSCYTAQLTAYLTLSKIETSITTLSELPGRAVGTIEASCTQRAGMLPGASPFADSRAAPVLLCPKPPVLLPMCHADVPAPHAAQWDPTHRAAK